MKISHLFDLPVVNTSMQPAIEQIRSRIQTGTYSPVFFINAHCVNVAFRDAKYRQHLTNNELNFADGIGVSIASKWFGDPLVDNVNGTDMFPPLCEDLARRGTRVFLLGGQPGVAEKLQARLSADHPGIRVVGVQHGHFGGEQSPEIAARIKASGAELVLVAMGVPRQEHWIAQYGPETGASVLLAVGGLFNFYAGMIPRAPLWMRRTGMEWFHRFLQEPGRMWRRYLIGNLQFLARMITWKPSSERSVRGGWIRPVAALKTLLAVLRFDAHPSGHKYRKGT
jgi:N-acetylglucosaminyldiphosphoundecaprenol N-acetyl-beta-D-mannosaminyltransferase